MGKPEKSVFAMTCNRLSLFLRKEGKSKSYFAKGKAMTVDLLSKMDSPPVQTKTDPDAGTNKNKDKQQMTIFYGGQVFVFDCISGDTARDVVLVMLGKESEDLPIARRASLHKFLAK